MSDSAKHLLYNNYGNSAAKSRGLDKVLLGHHYDDVIETFLLSLLYEGRISCFTPVTYLDRMDVTLLRPFIYIEEKDIRRFAQEATLPVVKNTCPADGNTKRAYIKTLLSQLEKESGGIRQRLFTAMKDTVPGWNNQND